MPMRVWILALAIVAAGLSTALGDDWVAVKLRGQVLQLVENRWLPLHRGDVVSDDRVIRTLQSGRVEFHRAREMISLGPQTQIQIHDETGRRFTTVNEYFGEVQVEANVENVQHFAVETPQLVAVVKGTIFVVRSDNHVASVEVKRGAVAVSSTEDHSHVTVGAGQEAHTSTGGTLAVSGKGTLPVVLDGAGKPLEVVAPTDPVAVADRGNGNAGSENSSNSGNGHSGNAGNGNNGSSGNGGNSGNGNGGNSGNSGHSTSGSGNSGNGNSGNNGNGNGNSGNSGNGNSGNNGNGNSGNNGNGNSGNGNGHS